jgi:hypothetical protein
MEDLTLSRYLEVARVVRVFEKNDTHGTAPYEVKQLKLKQVEEVMSKLRRYTFQFFPQNGKSILFDWLLQRIG